MGVENAICQAMFVFPAQPNYSARVKEATFVLFALRPRPALPGQLLGAIPRRIIPVKKSALPTYKGQYTFSAVQRICDQMNDE